MEEVDGEHVGYREEGWGSLGPRGACVDLQGINMWSASFEDAAEKTWVLWRG